MVVLSAERTATGALSYGNFGWNPSDAIGNSGLVRFDGAGEITYRFDAENELEPIHDC
jgi:hypothetical protein